MNSSLKLLTIRGIDIRIHATFPLILIWAAVQFGLLAGNLSTAIFGVAAVSLLFVLVTLHELGHSITAQRYGIHVKQIVLSPLGGVAQLNHIPEKPIQELIIAAAGPAVNFAVAGLMVLFAFLLGLEIGNPLDTLSGGAGFGLSALFSYVFVYNIFLALFNLLPAFPLDGGRIFRALLAMRLDYSRATSIAATIGKATAVALGFYGLFNGGLFLILIAVFIYTAAGQEATMVALRSQLRGVKVRQVYTPAVHRLDTGSTVQQAANLRLYTGQQTFPVLDGERLIGFITENELVHAMRTAASHSHISQFMRTDIRPVSCDEDLYEVYERFGREGLTSLPVVGNGRFLGLITRRHLIETRRLLALAPDAIPQGQSA